VPWRAEDSEGQAEKPMIVISKLRNKLIRRQGGSPYRGRFRGGIGWRMGLSSLAIFSILTVGCLETEARPVAKQPPGQPVNFDAPPGLTKGGPLKKVGPDLARLLQQRVLQQGAARGVPFGNYVAPEVAQALGSPIPPSGLPISVTGDGVAIDAVASGDPAQLLADLEALGLQGWSQIRRRGLGTASRGVHR
jgi:hypothetical protein